MVARPGPDLGLCFFGDRGFGDFVLRLQFRLDALQDNAGVFVRFRDPRLAPPELGDPRISTNPAWIAVHTGFEVQIDDMARDDGADRHRTGALYDIPTTGPQSQTYSRGSALQPGAWNDYEVTVSGDTYQVRLNDHVTSVYTNVDASRGVSAVEDASSGFVGLQQHTGAVSFRAIRIRESVAASGSSETKAASRVRRAAKKQRSAGR